MRIDYPPIAAAQKIILTLLVVLGAVLPAAHAQSFSVLYRFTGGADGGDPLGPLTLDKAGNLYGTTYEGGDPGCYGGCGTVFQLTHGSGGWSESTLHDFTGGADGGAPLGGLIFDAAGNLYGTAQVGGVSCGQEFGCGVAFELTPGSGGWNESVLYSFRTVDGYYPVAGLTFEKGHLYGTTPNGGSGNGGGTAFELSRSTGGWKDKTLHNFTSRQDGGEPPRGLWSSTWRVISTVQHRAVAGPKAARCTSY